MGVFFMVKEIITMPRNTSKKMSKKAREKNIQKIKDLILQNLYYPNYLQNISIISNP